MNKNLKCQLNAQGQSPFFIEKGYVWFVKKVVNSEKQLWNRQVNGC